MSDLTLLNKPFNPSDVRQYFHYDEAEDKTTLYQEQDVEPILNANKIEMNHIDQSGNFMKHVACIPKVVIEQWRKEGINFFTKNSSKDPISDFKSNKSCASSFLFLFIKQ